MSSWSAPYSPLPLLLTRFFVCLFVSFPLCSPAVVSLQVRPLDSFPSRRARKPSTSVKHPSVRPIREKKKNKHAVHPSEPSDPANTQFLLKKSRAAAHKAKRGATSWGKKRSSSPFPPRSPREQQQWQQQPSLRPSSPTRPHPPGPNQSDKGISKTSIKKKIVTKHQRRGGG